MNQYKQQLINFLSEIYGVDAVNIKKNLKGYTTEEELLFDCGDHIPDYVRRYVDLQAFIDDLTLDQYIDLGDGENVLYYGD